MNLPGHNANPQPPGRSPDRVAPRLRGSSARRQAGFSAFHCVARNILPSALLAVLLLVAAPLPAQTIWELDSYRIELTTAFAPAAELTPPLEAALGADVVARLDTLVGAPWSLAVAAAHDSRRRAMLADLGGLVFDDLGEVDDELDKLFLLRAAPAHGRWEVAVREFDVRTRVFGPVVVRRAAQLSKLRDAAVDAIFHAFAPLGRIERVEGEGKRSVAVRLKAASLPTRDASLRLVRPGEVFRPVFRYYDRDGKFRRADLTPWTFLTLETLPEQQASPGEVSCRLHSGLRSPLSARRRGRVEALVLGIAPTGQTTTLRLRSRTDRDYPLVGYDVYAHPPGVKTTTHVGATDRQGSLVVAPGESPLRLVIVKNGGRLLARLPMVPGLEATLTAEIADDESRLEAEGIVTGLQERLVDMVAEREVMLARARSRIEAGKLDEARQLIDALRRIPTAGDFSRRLEDRRARLHSDDLAVQARIDALFNDTQKLIAKHLDPQPVEQLWQELRAAKGGAGE